MIHYELRFDLIIKRQSVSLLGRVFLSSTRQSSATGWNSEVKARALPRAALNGNTPSVHLDNLARNRESETCSFNIACSSCIDPTIGNKHLLQKLRWDTYAMILHPH